MKTLLLKSVRQPTFLIFLASLAVYSVLVPWQVRVWQRTGDEPHYLIAAHSLVYDGDFDLANNYAQRDFASFYSEYFLTPHMRPGSGGQQMLTHNLGLSLLIAPAYRLGGLAGVEYFLAFLGACLAANIFALGYELTGHWLAAVVGWVALAFTPPLVWYVFLVYPEMTAGLGLIIAVRHLLSTTTVPPARYALTTLGLAYLPWLSARYLPILGLLIIWAFIRAWRERGWLFVALGSLIGLGSFALFTWWLYGSASPAAAYAGPTPLAFETASAGTRFLRGLVGWLLDNQRGIISASPIYIVALWGGTLLLRRKPTAGGAVLFPFVIMLITVALWGGFWMGWEYSARFMVAPLPLLGAGLAYWVATTRRGLALPVVAVLFGASLWVGRAVMLEPLTGIISSPAEILKSYYQIEIENWLPALGAYKYIAPGQTVTLGRAGGLGWEVPRGASGLVLRQIDLPEFPFGWYTARLPITTTAAPDTPLATIKIFSPHGGNYFSQTLYGRDVAHGQFIFNFKSPRYNGWGFPPTVLVSTTGQADFSLGTLAIEPEIFHSLILPTVWLILIAGLGVGLSRYTRPALTWAWPDRLTAPVGSGLALLVVASLAWSLQPHPRVYHTVDLNRTVGTEIADPLAVGGQTMRADPEAGQEAGILAASFSEIYAPGHYRLTASVRVDVPLAPGLTPAVLRVYASDAQFLDQRWDILATALPADGRYHPFTVDFENPHQQGLTFILNYTGQAALYADVLRVEPVR